MSCKHFQSVAATLPRMEALSILTYDHVGPVGGRENDDPIEFLNAVHLGQKAHQHTVTSRSAAVVRASSRRQSINLVLPKWGDKGLSAE